MLPYMSFEEEKERLIRELSDAQAETRAKYGMKPKPPAGGPEGASSKETKPAKA
jgi:hypothetical protein